MMPLETKSNENLEVARYYKNKNQNLNAVAGRLYYSVFQKMKFILISNKFDYKNFLDKNGYTKERLYSHGTIKHAFIDYCKNIGIKTEDLSWLMNLDQLYSIRRKVDYDERYLINPFEFNKQFVVAENIIDNIDCIEE